MDKKMEIERWYYELEKLMWAMVHDIANSERFYLEPAEVFADLSEELVKVVINYYGKDEDEMKPLLITSLRHRCRDLLKMEYGTHRQLASDIASMDEDIDIGDVEKVTLHDKVNRPSVDDTYFDLQGFLDALSDDAYWLVMEVLEPSDRMLLQFELSVMRKSAVFGDGDWRLTPGKLMYRRALGWTKNRLEKAWREIQQAITTW